MNTSENGEDEFECSECDYKCSSENDIIEHSAVHQYPSNYIRRALHWQSFHVKHDHIW